MNISNSAVNKHTRKLRADGYVIQVPGTYFYERGPNAKYLEKVAVEYRLQEPINDNDAIDKPGLCFTQKPREMSGGTLRAHLNGRIIFEVDKIGDIENLHYRPPGNDSEVIPFLTSSYNIKGSEWVKGSLRIPGNDWETTIQLQSTASADKLHIWPPQVNLTEDDVKDDPGGKYPYRFFEKEIYEILDFIEKWGMWKIKRQHGQRVGIGKGTVEYGYSDKAIDHAIPDGMSGVIGNPDVWCDNSHGEKEIESHKIENAMAIMTAGDRFKTIDERLVELETELKRREIKTFERLNSLYDKLEHFIMYAEAEMNLSNIEKTKEKKKAIDNAYR